MIVPKLKRNYNNLYLFNLFYSSSSSIEDSYDDVSSLGASGAITGIDTIFSCLFPTSTVIYYDLELPSWLYMIVFMVVDIYRSITLTNGDIDTIGHVGGGKYSYNILLFKYTIILKL
ncbi:hypothetical protein BCR36DRAFT_579546 [Piromyces finnis]|uniref:Peptidase S54 rhomboid domain-containing protein n=1 Tax=Piromyces finnis TaxID=1754191 RepID=A0A1Y1VMG7_9FUNG|nr:hypothetical protein BCR36DRAFT_579546 [Piromyces finnis]|eukprot:ORX60098.1 hypothetical protein BCR36DRAFT_579546 [Piromyces finnis]